MDKSLDKSVAKRILKFLKENDATVKTLSEGLDLSENIIRTTINRMKGKDLVQETGVFRDRFKIYRAGVLSEREFIKKDFLERLLKSIQNRGKRQTIFKKYNGNIDKFYSEEDIDMKVGFFVESLIQTAKEGVKEELKERLKQDPEFIKEVIHKMDLKNDPEFQKKLIEELKKI